MVNSVMIKSTKTSHNKDELPMAYVDYYASKRAFSHVKYSRIIFLSLQLFIPFCFLLSLHKKLIHLVFSGIHQRNGQKDLEYLLLSSLLPHIELVGIFYADSPDIHELTCFAELASSLVRYRPILVILSLFVEQYEHEGHEYHLKHIRLVDSSKLHPLQKFLLISLPIEEHNNLTGLVPSDFDTYSPYI